MIYQGKAIKIWQRVLVETMTLWVIMYSHSVHNQYEPNTIGFYLWLIFTLGGYFLLNRLLGQQLKLIHFLVLAVPLFLIAIMLGFTLLQAAALSGFIIWRIIRHEYDSYLETESLFIGISVIVVFFTYFTGHYNGLENSNSIVILLVIQLIILIIGRLLHNLNAVKELQNTSKKIWTVIGVSAITLGAAGLVFVTFPLIRSVYYFVVNSIISGFVFLLSPILNYLENIEPPEGEGEVQESDTDGEGRMEDQFRDLESEPLITSEHILIAFIILVATIVLIILFRNKNKLLKNISFVKSQNDLVTESGRTNERKTWRSHSSSKAPHNDIRKAFYKLEKWSKKNGVGRFFDESIDEWLSRYNLSEMIDDEAVKIYRDVRYGQFEIESDQKKRYYKQLDSIKLTLKQHYVKEK